MKNLLFTGTCILMIGNGIAVASEMEGYGQIIKVVEKTEQVNQPRQECTTETVQAPKERGFTGSVVGGILGGVAGHQVGSGRGNTAATIAGAVGGALVGDQVQNRNSGGTKDVQNCRTVNDYQVRIIGYRVTYKFKGGTYTDDVPERPQGDRIRVRQQITPLI